VIYAYSKGVNGHASNPSKQKAGEPSGRRSQKKRGCEMTAWYQQWGGEGRSTSEIGQDRISLQSLWGGGGVQKVARNRERSNEFKGSKGDQGRSGGNSLGTLKSYS